MLNLALMDLFLALQCRTLHQLIRILSISSSVCFSYFSDYTFIYLSLFYYQFMSHLFNLLPFDLLYIFYYVWLVFSDFPSNEFSPLSESFPVPWRPMLYTHNDSPDSKRYGRGWCIVIRHLVDGNWLKEDHSNGTP